MRNHRARTKVPHDNDIYVTVCHRNDYLILVTRGPASLISDLNMYFLGAKEGAMACMWKSENSKQESLLSVHHDGFGD